MEVTFLNELLETLKSKSPPIFSRTTSHSVTNQEAQQSLKPAEDEPDDAASLDEELRLQSTVYNAIYQPACLSLQHAALAGEYYLKTCFPVLEEITGLIRAYKAGIKSALQDDKNITSMLNELQDQLSKFGHFAESIQYRLQFAHEVMIEEGVFEKSWTSIDINQLVQWGNQQEDKAQDAFNLCQEQYLFDINLKLAFIDTMLDSTNLSSLFSLADFLNKREKAEVDHIHKVLFDKCQYLIYKIVNRNERGHWPDSHITQKDKKSLYDNVKQERKFGNETVNIKNPTLAYYQYFKELTDTRYNYNHVLHLDDNKEADILKSWKETIEKISQPNAQLEYITIHLLSRHLHKSGTRIKGAFEKSRMLFDKVRDYICTNDDAIYGRFNKYAYHSLVSLLSINHLKLAYNYFSEAISSGNKDDIKKWKKLFDECFRLSQEIAAQRHIISFNGYRVYLKGYIGYFENILLSESHEIKADDFNKDLKEIYPLFSEFKHSIDWGREKKYMALFLPYVESYYTVRVETIDKEIRLFLDSSYMLPSNFDLLVSQYQEMYNRFQEKVILVLQKITYNKLKEDVDAITNKWFQEAKATVELKVQENQHAVNQKVQESQSAVDQKVQENQYKNIEILSLFTAVIAFIVVGATTFPDFNDFYIMFLFMFGLALCLGLFVLFIDYVVTRSFNRKVIVPVSIAMGLFIVFSALKIFFPAQTLMQFRTPLDKPTDTTAVHQPRQNDIADSTKLSVKNGLSPQPN